MMLMRSELRLFYFFLENNNRIDDSFGEMQVIFIQINLRYNKNVDDSPTIIDAVNYALCSTCYAIG